MIDEACAVAQYNLEQATRTRENAEEKMHQAEAKMREAEAKMDKAKAELDKAKEEVDKAEAKVNKAKDEGGSMVEDAIKFYSATVDLYHTAVEWHTVATKTCISETNLYNDARKKLQECTSDVSLCNSEVLKSTGRKLRHLLGEPSAKRQKRWAELNKVLCKHKESHGTTSFSSMKNDVEMKNMLYTFVRHYNLEEGNMPEQIFEKLFNVISDCNRALYEKSHSESKLTHMIFFILAIVCIEVEASISEERVNGKQVHSNGAFEFLIRHGDIMCAVAECKKGDNIEEGVVQGLLGSEVICDLESVDRSKCIVTNYKQWMFYDNCQDYIYCFHYNLEMEGLMMMPRKEDRKSVV